MVIDHLTRRGLRCTAVADAERAAAALESSSIDVVVLDLGLPGMSGLDFLQQLRRTSTVPVIVASGYGDVVDRVVGLESGADDYMSKPFAARELEARIRAILRRSSPDQRAGTLEYGELRIDLDARSVMVGDREVLLTAKEFDLLAFLARTPRRVFTREELLHEVWGSSGEWQTPATVNEHIHRLRAKLGVDRWVVTVRAVGYRFEP